MYPSHGPTPASGSDAHPLLPNQQEQESSPMDEAEAVPVAPPSIPVVVALPKDEGDGDGDGDACDDAPLDHRPEEGAVPGPLSATSTASHQNPRHRRPHRLVRILVVADVDLRSAAQLAEFAIRDREDFADDPFDANAKKGGDRRRVGVDLCVACGPFSPIPHDEVWDDYSDDEEDDDPEERVLPGDDDTTAEDERQETWARRLREACRERWRSSDPNLPSASAAAAEGGTTCILSQLETIVCRVVFCPSADVDPPRMTSSRSVAVKAGGTDDGTSERRVSYERRYTPNSRNVHGRWLQLAPGLGVAGYSPRDNEEDEDGEEDGCFDGSVVRGGGGNFHRQHRRRRGKLDKSEEWMDQGNYPEGKHDASETRYESKVRGLLSLAPPCAVTSPISQPEYEADRLRPSQAILVTPFGFTSPDDDCRSAHSQPDAEMTRHPHPPSSSRCCPAHHDRLMRSSPCRERVLLSVVTSLSIDGGGAAAQFECDCSGVRVVSPGSLRERGEFAIVDVAMYEGEPRNEGPAAVDVLPPLQRWTVQNVKFRSMQNERRFYNW